MLGQNHWQVLFRNWDWATVGAMNDGDRRAPITLTRNAPVTQTPSGLALAQTHFLQLGGDRIQRLVVVHSVVRARVNEGAIELVTIPVLPCGCAVSVFTHLNDLLDGQLVLGCELKVPLIVSGHAHDGAITIAHQHVVTDPDRNVLSGQRVRDGQPSVKTLFFARCKLGFGRAALLAFFNECRDIRIGCGCMHGQRMLRCDGAKRDAHDGVDACGEDIHATILDELGICIPDVMSKRKPDTFAFADPVFLHRSHAFGPSIQAMLDLIQQFTGVIGDAQVITWDLALFDQSARAPATAINDLFVGQHSLVNRIPIDDLGFAIGNAFFQHLEKQPLVPLVVLRVASAHLPGPVDRQPHRLHLLFHVGNVVVRPLGGRNLGLDGSVFCGHPKRIPPHGHQHIKPTHAQLPGHHVVDGVVSDMAHVKLATWIGQHRAGVILGLWIPLCVLGMFDHTICIA